MENTKLLRHFLLCSHLANNILSAQNYKKVNFAKILSEYVYAKKIGNKVMANTFAAISESILAIQGVGGSTFLEWIENDNEDFSIDDLAELSVQEIEVLTKKHITQIVF